MSLLAFFGNDEWGAMFGASFFLALVSGLMLISSVLRWIAFIIFLIAFVFTGYQLFFNKKNQKKGDIADFKDIMGGIIKK